MLSNQGDSGTQPAGLGNGCPGPDAAALGERVGRDHAAMDRIGEGNHSDGTVLQARVGLLFTGRKEAVGIDVQTLRLEKFSQEGTVKLSRIRPFCGRILLDQRLRINDLAVAAGGENAAKLLNLTVSVVARMDASTTKAHPQTPPMAVNTTRRTSLVRSLVFFFAIVPRNYTRYDAPNSLGPTLGASDFALRTLCEVGNSPCLSYTYESAR